MTGAETTLHFSRGPAAGVSLRGKSTPRTLRVKQIGESWYVSTDDEGVAYERFAVDRSPGSCLAFYRPPS